MSTTACSYAALGEENITFLILGGLFLDIKSWTGLLMLPVYLPACLIFSLSSWRLVKGVIM